MVKETTQQHRVSMFKETFGTAAGKETLQILAKDLRAYSPTHVPGDPYQTAYNEGMRGVYNHIISILAADHSLLEMAFKEQESVNQVQALLNARKFNKGGEDLI